MTTASSRSARTAGSPGFAYKPDEPATDTIVAEVIAYDPTVLREVLEELHRDLAAGSDEGDTGLGDFGDHLLPAAGRARPHVRPPVTRVTGATSASRITTCAPTARCSPTTASVLSVLGWPILSRLPQRVPARVLDGGEVVDSLLSPGSRVAGVVRRSVLGPGVVVESGAEVHDSVVFADTVVRAGARVHWSVLDTGCVIEADARLGSRDEDALDDPDAVTLVGRGSQVSGQLRAGSRLEPGTTPELSWCETCDGGHRRVRESLTTSRRSRRSSTCPRFRRSSRASAPSPAPGSTAG